MDVQKAAECDRLWEGIRQQFTELHSTSGKYKELVDLILSFLRLQQNGSTLIHRFDFHLQHRQDHLRPLVNRFANKVIKKNYDGVHSLLTQGYSVSAGQLADFSRWWQNGATVCDKSARVAQLVGTEISLENSTYFTGFHAFLSNLVELVLSSERTNAKLSEEERNVLERIQLFLDGQRKSWFRRREWMVLLGFLLVVFVLVVMSIVFGWTESEAKETSDDDVELGHLERRKRRKSLIKVNY